MKILNNREHFLNILKTILPKNPICAEIGVEKGDFSQLIFNILNPQKLYLIDPWKIGHDKHGNENYGINLNYLKTAYSTNDDLLIVKERFSEQIKNNTVSIVSEFSYDAVNLFKNEYFDFIYIDACHLYECVKNDLFTYVSKTKKDGLICGHDYFNLSFTGVIKGVNEFCKKYNYEIIFLSNDSDWALKKIN